MRRSNPGIGGRTTSFSASGAAAIMARARAAVVFSSPDACASGLPIIRVMSRAMESAFFSIAATARSQSAARSATVLDRHARAASRAASRTAPTAASSARVTRHAGSPV